LVGDVAPLLSRGGRVVLGESSADPGGHDAALRRARIGSSISHEMHPPPLPSRAKHLGDGGLQPFVCVGDDELGSAQAAARRAAQELDPERLGLTMARGHAEHFAPAVGVDADGYYDRDRDDLVVAPDFDVGGVQPDLT
jgi:hypothetical protein